MQWHSSSSNPLAPRRERRRASGLANETQSSSIEQQRTTLPRNFLNTSLVLSSARLTIFVFAAHPCLWFMTYLIRKRYEFGRNSINCQLRATVVDVKSTQLRIRKNVLSSNLSIITNRRNESWKNVKLLSVHLRMTRQAKPIYLLLFRQSISWQLNIIY